jgi:hypothetical protein
MTLLMRVHGIECDPYDPEKFRLQLLGVDTGALSTLFLRGRSSRRTASARSTP